MDGYHMSCLQPPMLRRPAGAWYCTTCGGPAEQQPQEKGKEDRGGRARPPRGGRPRGRGRGGRKSSLARGPTTQHRVRWAEQLEQPATTSQGTQATQLFDASLTAKELANSLVGRLVRRTRADANGLRSGVLGKLEAGSSYWPLQMRYPEGPPEAVTLRQAKFSLLSSTEGHEFTPTATVTAVTELPDEFDLRSTAGVQQALQHLMPGRWTRGHATRLASLTPGGHQFLQQPGQHTPGQPQRVPTMTAEVDELFEVVDLARVGTVVDVFSGTGAVKKVFWKYGHSVISNDCDEGLQADYHLDALQPSSYRSIQQRQPIDVVVMSPIFAVLDLALPLADNYARMAVCCHVPGHYLTCAPEPRMAWFRELQRQRRVAMVMGLPRGPMGRRCMWLILFKTEATMTLLLKDDAVGVIGLRMAGEQEE